MCNSYILVLLKQFEYTTKSLHLKENINYIKIITCIFLMGRKCASLKVFFFFTEFKKLLSALTIFDDVSSQRH